MKSIDQSLQPGEQPEFQHEDFASIDETILLIDEISATLKLKTEASEKIPIGKLGYDPHKYMEVACISLPSFLGEGRDHRRFVILTVKKN